jgi:hypothetical protein
MKKVNDFSIYQSFKKLIIRSEKGDVAHFLIKS